MNPYLGYTLGSFLMRRGNSLAGPWGEKQKCFWSFWQTTLPAFRRASVGPGFKCFRKDPEIKLGPQLGALSHPFFGWEIRFP